MAKRTKQQPPKDGPVFKLSSEEATLRQMPQYNGFICRGGAHGDMKYNRARATRQFMRDMRREEASGGRPLPVCA